MAYVGGWSVGRGDSIIVQWMNATDEALDGILISDLSHLIKKYV